MEWINQESPSYSGSYIVTLKQQRDSGVHYFHYVAYYELDTNTWYKYDPFETNYKPTIKIEDPITGWADDVITPLG